MSPRRIPTKGELSRLQKLYRTDKKIAEALGNGVTEHLIGYWRRKKGIPRHSFPKFSEKDIQEVWDRFGDDFHAGMELGISKAAFYNWRRQYKITKKPEALKLEQLSLELHTPDETHHKMSGSAHRTIVQKILAARSGRDSLEVGEKVEVEPDLVMAPGDGGEVIHRFQETGTTYVWNPNRIVISLDGPAKTEGRAVSGAHKSIRDFVRRQQIRNFFEFGEGHLQQIVIEKGLILPGQLGLGCPHGSAALGSVGALVFPAEIPDMSDLWVTGKAVLTAPASIRVFITGRMPRGVFVRDVIHYVVKSLISTGAAEGRIIEFYGAAVEHMSISERITLCQIAPAAKATAVMCAFDATARRYVNPRARKSFTPAVADRNAVYAAEYTFEVNKMKPTALGPKRVDDVTPIEELEGGAIQQVYIGGMANGRFDDLKIAADILKGKRVNPDVRVFVHPVSRAVYMETLKKGLLRVFIEAGAVILNPGGLGDGGVPHAAPEERCLTTRFETTFDNTDGDVYQVSPATAAASALTGQITNPAGYVRL